LLNVFKDEKNALSVDLPRDDQIIVDVESDEVAPSTAVEKKKSRWCDADLNHLDEAYRTNGELGAIQTCPGSLHAKEQLKIVRIFC
jgi:hypothetical protein